MKPFTAHHYKGKEWGILSWPCGSWITFGSKAKMTKLAEVLNEEEAKDPVPKLPTRTPHLDFYD